MTMENTDSTDVMMHRPHLADLPDTGQLEPDFQLRRLSPADEPALAALLSEAFADPWTVVRVRERLTRDDGVKATFGIMHQGRLVATASAQQRTDFSSTLGFVHWVATHPEYRRKRLASALVGRVLLELGRLGFTSAALITQIERTAAVRAYLGFGFIPVYEFGGENQEQAWSRFFQNERRVSK